MKTHSLFFIVIAFSLLEFRCSLKENGTVDSSYETILISSAAASPDFIVTDSVPSSGNLITIGTTVRAKLNRKQGEASVRAEIESPTSQNVLTSASLFDNGIAPDEISGDSVYTGTLTAELQSSFFGDLNVTIAAGSGKSAAPSVQFPIHIRRTNTAPEISNVIMPDSVQIGLSTQTIEIRCTARDSDGLSDITNVQFTSFRLPDTVTTRGIFQMFDDGGANGATGNTDQAANDGIFTLSVQLPPSTIKASYRFVFQAFDLSKTGSNIISHDIVVH